MCQKYSYSGAKSRYWSQISHRNLKFSISHDVVILASEPEAMLRHFLLLILDTLILKYNIIQFTLKFQYDWFSVVRKSLKTIFILATLRFSKLRNRGLKLLKHSNSKIEHFLAKFCSLRNKLNCLSLVFSILLRETDFSHGLLNRWTDIFILPRPEWGEDFNPNNFTQTRSIFIKLCENTFLCILKARAWSIFTLSMS